MRLARSDSGIHRKTPTELDDFTPDLTAQGAIGEIVEYVADPVRKLLALSDTEPARGHGGGADTQSAGDGGLVWVVRHRVLVDSDIGLAERGLGILAWPVIPRRIRLTRKRWLSVPPETIS